MSLKDIQFYDLKYNESLQRKLELNITLGSRKTGKKEYRFMIKKNENIA